MNNRLAEALRDAIRDRCAGLPGTTVDHPYDMVVAKLPRRVRDGLGESLGSARV